MKKIMLLVLVFITLAFSVYANDVETLLSFREIASDGTNHSIQLALMSDSFEETETLLFFDFITNAEYPDIDYITLAFGIAPEKSIKPEILLIHVNSSKWYFLTGNIAFKFPSGMVKLNGKTGSEINSGSDLDTSVIITKGIQEINSSLIFTSPDDVIARIYTTEKGNIDFAIPAKFFQKAFSFTPYEIKSLKAEKGL